MALGTDDAQTAQFHNLLLLISTFCLIFFQQLMEGFSGLVQFRIVTGYEAGGERNLLFCEAVLRHLFFRFEFRVAAQDDIGTTTCHVGGDGHSTQPSGFCHDGGFLVMLFGVQHIMLHAPLFQQQTDAFGIFDGNGAHQYRLSRLMCLHDPVCDGLELGLLIAENGIIVVHSGNRLIGRDHHNVHVVDIPEFFFFGLGRTGHTRQLVIHSEVVLQGNGGQRLGLGADEHTFLCFNRLMESAVIAASEHETACKFIDDDDFPVFHDVVHIPLHDISGLQGFQNVVVDFHVFRVAEVIDAEELLCFFNAFFRQTDSLFLLFDGEVLFIAQSLYKPVCRLVQVRGLVPSAGNNQRCSGFIDEDGVHFVDDGEVQFPLGQLFLIGDHVIPQVVETEFVIGSVCDVRLIGFLSGLFGNPVNHTSHRQTQEGIDLSHPLGISLRQIVVDGDDMNTLTFQRIQIGRQRCHQGLTFTGLHLGNPALMQGDAADNLYFERLHSHASPCSLPAHSEGFHQQIIQGFPLCQPLFEFRCFSF